MSDQAKPSEPLSEPSAGAQPGVPKLPSETAEPVSAGSPSTEAEKPAFETLIVEAPVAGSPLTESETAELGAASTTAQDTAKPPAAPAVSAPGPATAAAQAQLRPSKIVIGLCLAVIGVLFVGLIYLFTPPPTKDQDLPYLLAPLEKHLDAHLRYKVPPAGERRDWRNDFLVEQTIWTGEISKIMLGRQDAKPAENKRDYLLFLADSYFKDEPHFASAKAAYLAANATRRIPHPNAYDLSDDELWRRIGYCDIRLGFYTEADEWLKRALKANDDMRKGNNDIQLQNTHARILDDLAENYCRQGEPKKAELVIKQRLSEMRQERADNCVEVPVLFDSALVYEKEGNLKEAERFYKLAIKMADTPNPGQAPVVPESSNDNNRVLARVLMGYSHLLRLLHRNDEAIAAMRRALCVYDNPPG